MEICAVKIQLFRVKLIIFCIYRAPSGNLKIFYDSLERILNHFQRPKVTYLICGDLNINFLNRTNYDTIKLEALLDTFNMKQVVNFPTRKNINYGTLIDPIFIDSTIFENSEVTPFINWLSDHDAQIIRLKNINIETPLLATKLKTRLINDQTIDHFLALLKEETWETFC
jgi:exonuclease III